MVCYIPYRSSPRYDVPLHVEIVEVDSSENVAMITLIDDNVELASTRYMTNRSADRISVTMALVFGNPTMDGPAPLPLIVAFINSMKATAPDWADIENRVLENVDDFVMSDSPEVSEFVLS